MARRIAWTNNSSGHDGTTIHRSTATMDPLALPAPLATVAAGTSEYIDGETLADGTYYYRVQDYQGASVSAASDEQSFIIAPDYANAQVGDEIGGGIYAGTITYADARQFHIVAAMQAGELSDAQVDGQWSESNGSLTGASDPDDGLANQQLVLADSGDTYPAFEHCNAYSDGGFTGWYLPAINELELIKGLADAGHPEFSTALSDDRWSSTEIDATNAEAWRFDQGSSNAEGKSFWGNRARPIRRVAV